MRIYWDYSLSSKFSLGAKKEAKRFALYVKGIYNCGHDSFTSVHYVVGDLSNFTRSISFLFNPALDYSCVAALSVF